jgi:hypothetical protein
MWKALAKDLAVLDISWFWRSVDLGGRRIIKKTRVIVMM